MQATDQATVHQVNGHQVKRRHVVFLQGYDPRGLAAYYRMFRGELRKFAALYGASARNDRPKTSADGLISSWPIATGGGDWQTHTQYDFVRWEDLVQRDRDMPAWRIIIQSVAIYGWLIVSGVLARFAKAHWRFAMFISYPYLVLIAEVLLSALLGYGVWRGAAALGLPDGLNAFAATATAISLFAFLVVKGEPRTYMLYLMADTIFTYQFAHERRPDWKERIERVANHLVEVARNSDADELLVVGHSSGSFLGTEIMARALEIDPQLGEHTPRIMLLTVGANLPIVGFLPHAKSFRDHLRQLAISDQIGWIDCQSRKDVMNFFPFDPITGHGIDTGEQRRNPKVVNIRLRDLIDPKRYNVFRWRFFSVHFQFVMANDRANAYDFFMMVCGPLTLDARMRYPEQALTIATGTKDARVAAWKAIAEGYAPSSQSGASEP